MKEMWMNFKIKFKNRWSFLRYGCKLGYIHPWTMLINLSILIYTVINAESLLCIDNLFLLVFLLFTNFVWQVIGLMKDYCEYTVATSYNNPHEITEQDTPILSEEVTKIYDVRDLSFRNSRLLYSSRINKILQGEIPVHIRENPIKENNVWRYIKNYRGVLLPFLNDKWHEMQHRKGSFYNEQKLCMASEFTDKGGFMEVEVCKGCYYNSYLTNFIYTRSLSHQSGFPLYPPHHIANTPICKLDKATMGDHIGVSTLVVTTDGKAIILRQNNKALTSADHLTPSGTGSADFKDFRPGEDFRETIRAAAERELCEETGISTERIAKTVITGFYRDITRGGKPEFCCVTFLNCDCSKLADLKPNAEEQRDDFEIFQILNADGKLGGADFPPFARLACSTSRKGEQPSLALYMCFGMLCTYYGLPFPQAAN